MGRRKSAILAVILGFTFLNAEQVEITSNDFFADENKQTSEFIGNVNIKKGSFDELKADKVVVYFDKKRQPIKYVATGNARAKILRGNLKHFLSSDKAISQNDEIIFQKNANYENNDSLKFKSDEVIYNTKTKIVRSEANFTITRNGDKALGDSGSYDLGKKQTQIKGLRAWVEEKQRF